MSRNANEVAPLTSGLGGNYFYLHFGFFAEMWECEEVIMEIL